MFVSYEPIPTAQWGDKETKRTQANGRNSKQNTKYPKLTRLAGNLLDENKAESERTEETSETRVGTRRNKKVDTYSNNKTWTRNRLCYPTPPRATDAERAITRKPPLEWPVKHWQSEKAKRGVTDKFSKTACGGWTTARLWSHFHWTTLNQPRGGQKPSNSKQGPQCIMPPARRPNTTELRGVTYFPRNGPLCMQWEYLFRHLLRKRERELCHVFSLQSLHKEKNMGQLIKLCSTT